MEKDSQKLQKSAPRRGQFAGRIAGESLLGSEYRSMVVELTGSGAEVFATAKAGQFVQFACRDLDNSRLPVPLLRRPFSIAGLCYKEEPTKGVDQISIEIIYQVLGPGTRWLAERCQGYTVNILGPLGNGFALPEDKKSPVVLIGGGVGLPPMFFLADQLAQKGYQEVVGFAGVRTWAHLENSIVKDKYQQDVPLEPQSVLQQFNRSGTKSVIATDDGSFGFSGNTVEALGKFLARQDRYQRAQLYACGPEPMLKAAAELAKRLELSCQVCMEAYMACGIGVCQSCVVQIRSQNNREDGGEGYKLVCTNGPVFDAGKVIWE